MSRSAHIFMSPEKSLEDLVRNIESVLDGTPLYRSDDFDSWYEFENSSFHITVGEHTFENDRDMDFENYQYDITVRERHIRHGDLDISSLEFTRMLYEKLKALGRYNLMFVDDLQVKLDECVRQN